MHSVPRSPEPEFLAELRSAYTNWDDLGGGDRRRIRDVLARDFGLVCAYCEQFCQPTQPRAQTGGEESPPPPDEESIDHLRPRSLFPTLWLDWPNLIYACYRCNQSKGNAWPVADDVKNRLLAAAYRSRYTPISEYVNPNEEQGLRAANEFFDFDFDTGEIKPAEQIDDVEWSMARRTIDDIDLNDELSGVEAYDPDHLFNQRRYSLYLFIEQITSDSGLDHQIMWDATLPDKPFSSFISAYLKQSFPGFA